ncbi:MAG: hypothetical protein GX575_13895 [Candidatus Anammoximicrobium sp.]|nr:hypothetical protein [Candidatus Anammoximicrobium sp.]
MARPSRNDLDTLVFFLGGHDLEMVTIRQLLEAQGVAFHDRHLAWGAAASAYDQEIAAALRAGRLPILVELKLDLSCPLEAVRVVDHHNEQAGQATALEQVFQWLGLPPAAWTRWFELVAANDRGHIAAMLALQPPATLQELRRVREADRAAQGVSAAEEVAAPAAVAACRQCAAGRLSVVDWTFDRVSAVADRMERALGGPGYENLLVRGPHTTTFFGDGPAVEFLTCGFPGSPKERWWGGDLPRRGFWGGTLAGQEVEEALVDFLASPPAAAEPSSP